MAFKKRNSPLKKGFLKAQRATDECLIILANKSSVKLINKGTNVYYTKA